MDFVGPESGSAAQASTGFINKKLDFLYSKEVRPFHAACQTEETAQRVEQWLSHIRDDNQVPWQPAGSTSTAAIWGPACKWWQQLLPFVELPDSLEPPYEQHVAKARCFANCCCRTCSLAHPC